MPQIAAPLGAHVRLRIRARDVALQPAVLASSASNQLAGTVLRVLEREGAYAAVELALRPEAAPGERLWALVTRRSVHGLGIAPGAAMDRQLQGGRRRRPRDGAARGMTARHDPRRSVAGSATLRLRTRGDMPMRAMSIGGRP